jgi:hypothetical protein
MDQSDGISRMNHVAGPSPEQQERLATYVGLLQLRLLLFFGGQPVISAGQNLNQRRQCHGYRRRLVVYRFDRLHFLLLVLFSRFEFCQVFHLLPLLLGLARHGWGNARRKGRAHRNIVATLVDVFVDHEHSGILLIINVDFNRKNYQSNHSRKRVDVWYEELEMLKSEKLLFGPLRENDVLENNTDGMGPSGSVLSLHLLLTIVVANVGRTCFWKIFHQSSTCSEGADVRNEELSGTCQGLVDPMK